MSDLIDRGVAKQHIRTALHADMDLLSAQFANAIGNVLDGVSTVDAVPVVHGRWNGYNTDKEGWKRTDGSPVFLTCSECGGTVLNNGSAYWNYCPNCGAKMEVEHD